jgi:hypothetical protein
MKKTKPYGNGKTLLVVAVMVAIALLHVVTGSQYQGPFPLFVNGYLIDILLPFGLYLLLCLNDNVYLDSWFIKGSLVFVAAFLVEMAQYKGVFLFGRTFDPLDIVMYGLGVLLAIIGDQLILPRFFEFWRHSSARDQVDIDSEDGMFSWRKH